MQRSRRTVLAAVPIVLAGCGRSFRDNSVPGGLSIENERDRTVTVSVSAARLPPKETAASGGPTPSPTPETPDASAVASPELTGEYEVQGGGNRGVSDYFPTAAHWAVEVVVDDDSGNRARIQLYEAIPGPTGADTIRILVGPDNVTARATTVD
jgi:hypothetical protein